MIRLYLVLMRGIFPILILSYDVLLTGIRVKGYLGYQVLKTL